MKKRILIVGSGVLGAYLSEIFLKKSYEVYIGTRYLRKNDHRFRNRNRRYSLNGT